MDKFDREAKKQQFMQEYLAKRKGKQKKIFASAFVLMLLIAGGIWYVNSRPYTSDNGGNYFIQQEVSYQGKKVEMTKINAVQTEQGLQVPLKDIIQNKIISFQFTEAQPEHVVYGRIKGKLPIMAYVSTSGRVVVSTSICEPCYGTEFYLQDDYLVCVTCGTQWRNTDHFGVAGGCVKYSPEEIKYTVQDGNLEIPINELQNWQPRYFTDDVMG